MKITVQNLECDVQVRRHDSSPTGLQYKVVVNVPKRLLTVRRTPKAFSLHMPTPKRSKPKHDLGSWAIHVGNALGRQLGFKYGWSPSIDKGSKNTTVFTFFFSDAMHARELGFEISDALLYAELRWELEASKQGLPAFLPPYRRAF